MTRICVELSLVMRAVLVGGPTVTLQQTGLPHASVLPLRTNPLENALSMRLVVVPFALVALPISRYQSAQAFPSTPHHLPLVKEALIVENNRFMRVTRVQLPYERPLRSDYDLATVDIRTIAPLLRVEVSHVWEAR